MVDKRRRPFPVKDSTVTSSNSCPSAAAPGTGGARRAEQKLGIQHIHGAIEAHQGKGDAAATGLSGSPLTATAAVPAWAAIGRAGQSATREGPRAFATTTAAAASAAGTTGAARAAHAAVTALEATSVELKAR